MGARDRIHALVDADSFQEMDKELSSTNILGFVGYDEKLRSAREASQENESVLTGLCTIDGLDSALFAMDPNFMMGSMGSITGEKITRLFERATRENLPVIGIAVSGGARIQEGILSLMQIG